MRGIWFRKAVFAAAFLFAATGVAQAQRFGWRPSFRPTSPPVKLPQVRISPAPGGGFSVRPPLGTVVRERLPGRPAEALRLMAVHGGELESAEVSQLSREAVSNLTAQAKRTADPG